MNAAKFERLKKLKLPIGQYAVTGSGPLGIRNLREMGDIDIVVTPELWDTLAAKLGVVEVNGIKKIVFPGEGIEAFSEQSNFQVFKYEDAPSVAERIAHSEIIDGLPIESLEHALYFKRKMGREKDLLDVHLIETWIKSRQDD